MSLNYRILWVDDSTAWVASIRPSIEEFMTENGLTPLITFQENGNEIENIFRVENIDLLILDQGLPGKNGDEIIKDVRRHGEITEIVFYSQDDEHLNAVSQWDGVRYTHRDDADETIKGVIKEFIERNKSITVMRGIIIAEAIDVENKLTAIIKKIFGDKADLFKNKILDKPWLDFAKKQMFVQSCLNDKLKEAGAQTPQDAALITKLSGCCDILKLLQTEVIDQRNILAHSDKETNAEGHLVLNALGGSTQKITFNNEWKNTIRENMKKQRANLQIVYDLF